MLTIFYMIFSIPVCACLLLFLFGGLGVNIHGCGDVCGSYNIFRVVFPLIPSHLFLPPVSPFLYIGSLSFLCQLLLYNTIFILPYNCYFSFSSLCRMLSSTFIAMLSFSNSKAAAYAMQNTPNSTAIFTIATSGEIT